MEVNENSIKKRLGLLIFLLAIVITIIMLLIETNVLLSSQRWPDNAVSEFENRYEKLAKDIFGVKNIGFFAGNKRDMKWWGAFNLAQYTLAPVVVIDSIKKNLIICEFFFLDPKDKKFPTGTKIVKKYSKNLYLLKGKED